MLYSTLHRLARQLVKARMLKASLLQVAKKKEEEEVVKTTMTKTSSSYIQL
jgi:hypothetical protein